MFTRLCVLFCCCVLLGCGSSKLYDVRAVVSLDGKPLTEAVVLLLPVRENAASAFGITDTEGQVILKTGEQDGVFPGAYIVVVSKLIEEKQLSNNEIRALAEIGIQYNPGVVELVPSRYSRRETSELRAKIGYWHSKNMTFNLWSE